MPTTQEMAAVFTTPTGPLGCSPRGRVTGADGFVSPLLLMLTTLPGVTFRDNKLGRFAMKRLFSLAAAGLLSLGGLAALPTTAKADHYGHWHHGHWHHHYRPYGYYGGYYAPYRSYYYAAPPYYPAYPYYYGYAYPSYGFGYAGPRFSFWIGP